MRIRKWAGLCLAAVLLFVLAGCRFGGLRPAPARTRPEVGGFYVSDAGSTDSLASLKRHYPILDELYPLWYHVRTDGSLDEQPVQEAVDFAHKQGIKVYPLINAVPSQDTVLLDTKARDNAIANIVRVVKEHNYDGVDIDFEFMPTSGKKDFSVDRPMMTEFVKLLSQQLTKLGGKETHMAVLPHTGTNTEISGIYDYSGLAPFVHKVTIMTYDYSTEGGPPGPLAPFSWVEQNISTAIKQGFKPKQICLGVATYGYDWPAGRSGGFSSPTKGLLEKAASSGTTIKWSDKYQEPYYVYTNPEGVQREVWFENAATVKTKMQLVEKYKVSGICIWRLGYEDPKFWQEIQARWGKRK